MGAFVTLSKNIHMNFFSDSNLCDAERFEFSFSIITNSIDLRDILISNWLSGEPVKLVQFFWFWFWFWFWCWFWVRLWHGTELCILIKTGVINDPLAARPTVSPVANIVFTLFGFARFEKDGRSVRKQ